MKLTKKLLSALLVLVMICAMATSALAVNITIEDEGGVSSYAAYRLLNATNAVDAQNKATGKFAYTVNEKYRAVLTEVTGENTDAKIVEYISGLDTDEIRDFADEVYAKLDGVTPDYTVTGDTFSNVPQGYYLIVETAIADNDDVISLVMLDTAGAEDINVSTKESTPTVEKKVKDVDDSTGKESGWQDSADYDIGDTIPYQVTGTVSNEYAKYETYYYEFHDTMTHLTYNNDAKVYLVNGDSKTDITANFDIDWNAASKTLTVTCTDLKDVNGVVGTSKIVLEYTATLDNDANIGAEGNPNTVYLTYNNNPYYDGNGEPETNNTPEDTNIVFTYKAIVNKIDEDKVPLEGAGFTLYKYIAPETEGAEGTWEAVGEEIKDVTTFSFIGLDAGIYKLVETTVPAGYNQAADIEFVIVAMHDVEADAPKLTSLIVKDTQGNVISGVDMTFTAEVNAGSVTTDVVNKTGTELPSTGGIGTTIFYVLGGVLVVGAAVLLITKKRMNGDA